MRLPKSLFKLKKRNLVIIRRVMGMSMAPALRPDSFIVATRLVKPQAGHVVVIYHDGKEKIKRLREIKDNQFFVEGDNSECSMDSRHFGPIEEQAIIGVVIWPRLKLQ